jgi:hypothetical protein
MYTHIELLLKKIEKVDIQTCLWILSEDRTYSLPDSLVELIDQKIDWEVIQIMSLKNKMQIIREANNFWFTRKIISLIDWQELSPQKMLEMISWSWNGLIAERVIETKRLGGKQIIAAISKSSKENERDCAIYAAFKLNLLSPAEIIKAAELAESNLFIALEAHKLNRLNLFGVMILIKIEHWGHDSKIAKKIIQTDEWRRLDLKKSIIALNLSDGNKIIADALLAKINWEKLTKEEAVKIIQSSRKNDFVVLEMKKRGLIETYEIENQQIKKRALKLDFKKMNAKEIMSVLMKEGTDCLLNEAIRSKKLSEKQILNAARKIPKAYYSVSKFIEEKSCSPEFVLEAAHLFPDEYEILIAAVECRKLSPGQMLEIVKISDNNQSITEEIE